MSHRIEEKEARRRARIERERAEARRAARARLIKRGIGGAVALAVVAGLVVIAAGQSGGTAASEKANATTAKGGAPDFAALDVVTGRTLRLRDLGAKPTLLFFSEGASCQACLVQIAELQKEKALERRGIQLVSVTTDKPDVLREVAAQYGIKTPLLSDFSTRMSADYGMLGHGGMGHPQTDGHAFALVKNGRLVWHKAYAEMFVPTKKLLSDLDRRAV